MPKLFISAGHGYQGDPGAVSNGTTEYNQISKIATEAVKDLRVKGVDAVLVPLALSLQERIKWVNENTIEEDTLVEIHMNAASAQANGAEAFYYDGSQESMERCVKLLGAYVGNIGLRSRGVKPDTATRFGRLGIIRDTKPWAFLLELGFITNLNDLNIVRREGKDAFVQACLELVGVKEQKQHVSPWAEESVEKAKKKGVMVQWDYPQEEVTVAMYEYVWRNLKAIKDVKLTGRTKEELAVILDRLGLLD